MKYYFGGVNGVGKSTLLKKIVESKPEFTIYSGSKQLMESLGVPGDYDALRNMDHSVSTAAFGKLVEAECKKPGDELIDGHYLNLKWGKLYPINGEWLTKVDALILVTAPVETVFERVEGDTRDRALFAEGISQTKKLAILTNFMRETEKAFIQLAQGSKLPHLVIDTTNTDISISKFIEFDAGLRS